MARMPVLIATTLSDIDSELGATESCLAKTRTVKQGMMQELLTGRNNNNSNNNSSDRKRYESD